MTTLRVVIGIASEAKIRARVIAIARGEYVPKKGEPKVWFSSLNTVAQVLSEDNVKLLNIIMAQHPKTIKELSVLSERAVSNLSRTLKTMEKYGFVELQKKERNRVQPVAKATEFDIQMRYAIA